MSRKIKFTRIVGAIAMVAAAVAIGFNVTTANAQAGAGNGNGAIRNAGIQVAKALFGAVEQATGLNQQQLFKELDGTKTLTDIVTEHNGDPAAVQAAAKTTLTNEINAAVTSGKITQAQADKIIARLDPLLSGLMNHKFDLNRVINRIQQLIHGIEVNALVRQTAQATKLTPRQIVQALSGGQTLAQIAQVNNADISTIVSAVTTSLSNRIDKMVAAGRLSQDQATKLIDALPTSLTTIMNEPDPLKGTGRSQAGGAAPNATGTPQPTSQATEVATASLNAA